MSLLGGRSPTLPASLLIDKTDGPDERGYWRGLGGRGDCHRVGQSVTESDRVSQSLTECRGGGGMKNGKPFFSVVTTTFLVN